MFLATTALSEFWDTRRELIFLGEWCRRYDRRADWEGLNYRTMTSPWENHERFFAAMRDLDQCGERLIERLADYFNSVHRISRSRRYWRILIGPWLMHYTHTLYIHYVHLCEAFRQFPDLATWVMDPKSFRVPVDYEDFHQLHIHDENNLQLFSQLLDGMGYRFPAYPLNTGRKPATDKKGSHIRRSVRSWNPSTWIADLALWSRRRICRVAFYEMCVPDETVERLTRAIGVRAASLQFPANWSFPPFDPAFDRRRNLLASIPSSTPFEHLLICHLPQNLPTVYLEGYSMARQEIMDSFPKRPDILVSAAGWYGNDMFKFLAAEAADQGSRLVTAQHGGGYGIYRMLAAEAHEVRIGDTFLAWGWADHENGACRNLPALQTSARAGRQTHPAASGMSRTVLYVSTEYPRYMPRLQVGSQGEAYVEWQQRFFSALPKSIRPSVLFRPYPHNFGRGIRERLSENFSTIALDNGVPFEQRLNQCRMAVIDHLGTTFLQALAANIPTVLFWDPVRWEVRKEAEPYLEDLWKAGLWFHSPETAAARVAEVYQDPSAWWHSELLQRTRSRFVERYARARNDWMECWADFFKQA